MENIVPQALVEAINTIVEAAIGDIPGLNPIFGLIKFAYDLGTSIEVSHGELPKDQQWLHIENLTEDYG